MYRHPLAPAATTTTTSMLPTYGTGLELLIVCAATPFTTALPSVFALVSAATSACSCPGGGGGGGW